MKRVKCPRCDLNYINESEDYCDICKTELAGKSNNGSHRDAEIVPVFIYLEGKSEGMLNLYEKLHEEIMKNCKGALRDAWSTFIAYYKDDIKFINGVAIEDDRIKIYLPSKPVGMELNLKNQNTDSKDFHFYLTHASEIPEVMKAIKYAYAKR